MVTKDIAPFSIVGGVQAKLIRMRFDDALIEHLQQAQWRQYNMLGLSLPWDDMTATLDAMNLPLIISYCPISLNGCIWSKKRSQ